MRQNQSSFYNVLVVSGLLGESKSLMWSKSWNISALGKNGPIQMEFKQLLKTN